MSKVKETKKDELKPKSEEGPLHTTVSDDPLLKSNRLLYANLHRFFGKDYDDPYKEGPEKMARYFDSFLEFIRTEYPETKDCKGNLKSLIPKVVRMKLPDSTIITVKYKMEGREADYEISNESNSTTKITEWHIRIAQMFKNDIQESIFKTITMFLDTMTKGEREKMESKYLEKARSFKDLKDKNQNKSNKRKI